MEVEAEHHADAELAGPWASAAARRRADPHPQRDDRFVELAESVNSEAWEDDGFEIRFAFFSPTSSKNRIRILEGRHRRLQEKAEMLRVELERSPSGIDKYLEEWRRHSLESAMREIAWLEDMIKTERK